MSVIAEKRCRLRTSCLWATCLLLLSSRRQGCARIISMEYQPTNPLKGQRTVGSASFRYRPSDEHRVRPRQVETDPASKNKLYLAQEIGAFFADALSKELDRSGYRTTEPSDHIVSGAITRFDLDWKSGQKRSFELAVDYTVRSDERTPFIWHPSSGSGKRSEGSACSGIGCGEATDCRPERDNHLGVHPEPSGTSAPIL